MQSTKLAIQFDIEAKIHRKWNRCGASKYLKSIVWHMNDNEKEASIGFAFKMDNISHPILNLCHWCNAQSLKYSLILRLIYTSSEIGVELTKIKIVYSDVWTIITKRRQLDVASQWITYSTQSWIVVIDAKHKAWNTVWYWG